MPAAARSLSSWPTSAVWSSPASAQSADPRRSTSHPHLHGSVGDSCCQERTRALAATDLSGDRFTIITGGPGAGKTSLLPAYPPKPEPLSPPPSAPPPPPTP